MEDSDGKITGRSMQFGCNPIMGQKLIIDSVTKTRASVRKGLTQSFLFHLRPISKFFHFNLSVYPELALEMTTFGIQLLFSNVITTVSGPSGV